MTEQSQEYHILYTDGDEIRDNGTRFSTLEQLQADFSDPNWTIIPVGEVPEIWQDMTIKNGKLVNATAKVVAARRVARLATDTATARQARAVDYAVTTDPLWLEIQEDIARSRPDDPKCVEWLAKKAEIRLAHPKPNIAL